MTRMFDSDDLSDLFQPATPANPAAVAKVCRRHSWVALADGTGPGEPRPLPMTICNRCGRIRNEEARLRNRRNRQRGSAFELKVAKALGGRRTGPLGGRDDVVVGELFAVQTKKDKSLSLNGARKYHRDLRGTFPTRGSLVVHANPGPNPEPVVIVPLDVWIEHFGKDGMDE